MAALGTLATAADFEKAISSSQSNVSVVHFAADWAMQCKQVTEVIEELAKLPEISQKGTKFYVCPSEDLPEISIKHKVDAVPTVIFFRNGKQFDRIDGADIPQLTSKVKLHSSVSSGPPAAKQPSEPLNDRLKKLINRHKIMVFMKGDRDAPRCGFSKQLMSLLKDNQADFDTFDILTDNDVRQGLKEYSEWPTYPQVYVNGELIGGLDIVVEMQKSGELTETLNG